MMAKMRYIGGDCSPRDMKVGNVYEGEIGKSTFLFKDDVGDARDMHLRYFEVVKEEPVQPLKKVRFTPGPDTPNFYYLTKGEVYDVLSEDDGFYMILDDTLQEAKYDVKHFAPVPADPEPLIRTFETGATRNLDYNKLDYEGFLSPTALHAFAEYMHGKRVQADGTLRASDNWQKGIEINSYMQSMFRHMMDVWLLHRGHAPIQPESGQPVELKEALCALMFNVQGYLHESLKGEGR